MDSNLVAEVVQNSITDLLEKYESPFEGELG